MRYKICVYEMLDHILIVFTDCNVYGDGADTRSRLYTFSRDEMHIHRPVEVIAGLAARMAETTP